VQLTHNSVVSQALSRAKLETEQALEEKALPLDVVIECLTLREGRQSIDVVRDRVEAELHKVGLD